MLSVQCSQVDSSHCSRRWESQRCSAHAQQPGGNVTSIFAINWIWKLHRKWKQKKRTHWTHIRVRARMNAVFSAGTLRNINESLLWNVEEHRRVSACGAFCSPIEVERRGFTRYEKRVARFGFDLCAISCAPMSSFSHPSILWIYLFMVCRVSDTDNNIEYRSPTSTSRWITWVICFFFHFHKEKN